MRKILIIFALLIFSTAAWAAGYTVQKLPNGQTVIVYPIKDNPIVTIDTWIKTGSINENDTNNGVAHFLEHLFFKGTKAHPTGDFDRILESKGAIVNAATSKDFTHYYITIPSEYFDTAMELHADMLLNPQIPRKELEKERKVVLEEIAKDGNTPSQKVFDNLNDMMYTKHPYKRKVIGSADIIGTIRREEILEYFNNFYAPSNMVTLVVGDVEPEKAVAKIQQSFNQEYKKPVNKHYRKESPLQSQKRKVDYTDTQSGYMMIGFRGVNISDKETFALDVLAEILGGGKSSRLYRDIKEQKGLAFSISASNGSYRDDGIFYISANFTPTSLEKLEKSIFEEISNLQKYGITDEELQRAKNIIVQDTYYSRESTSNISSELGYIMALTNSSELYDTYVDGIKQVTAEQVVNTAKKYLGVNKSAVSIVLPKSMEGVNEVKEIKAHSATKVSEHNGVTKYQVDNGSTLLVNQNQNNDIIAMSIIAKGGEFLESIPGEGTLAAAVMTKGTKKYSAQELAQLMDENGIIIEPGCSEDFFVINVQTTTAQLDKTMEILDEIMNYATFDDYEIEKKRSEILNKIRQRRDVPMNVALENFKTIIFEGKVYSHSNKILEKTLPTIQKEDIVKYYNKVLDSKNIIVSINGNVDPQKMITEFGSILKDKKAPVVNYANYKVTKTTEPKTASQTIKDLKTSWLFLGWQTSGVQNKKDFVTLKVMNTILGSGMSSRLFKNLREQDGLAYQLGSSYSPQMLAGTFFAYIGTNPDTLDYSREKILKEIERLKMEFVSDTELQDAKDRLKGSFIIAMETNAEKASNIGIFETYGFGYDFLNEYIKMIDEVTASDIISVANKYFNNNIIQSYVK